MDRVYLTVVSNCLAVKHNTTHVIACLFNYKAVSTGAFGAIFPLIVVGLVETYCDCVSTRICLGARIATDCAVLRVC